MDMGRRSAGVKLCVHSLLLDSLITRPLLPLYNQLKLLGGWGLRFSCEGFTHKHCLYISVAIGTKVFKNQSERL